MEVLEKLAVPLDMLIGGITPSDAYEDEGNEEATEEAPSSGPIVLGPPLLPRSLSQLELSLPWIPQILLPKACKAIRLPKSLAEVEQTLPSLQRITIYHGMQVQHASHEDIKVHRLDRGASTIDLDIRWLERDEEGLGRAMKHVPGSRWDEAI
ncbi:hypothetical protein DL93DRAFT_2069691 [Clavulina sp. PMI_390]|nr:hypothetical protein DL93DRAFT_2069691 [Clavulina sp. PMI_390]